MEPAGVAATTSGANAKTGTGRPTKTTKGKGPKGAPTNKRDRPAKRERTTPVKFVRQSMGELRKVVYPTGPQLINYFIVVLVFVLFVIAYVSLLDLGFGCGNLQDLQLMTNTNHSNGEIDVPDNFQPRTATRAAGKPRWSVSAIRRDARRDDFDIDLGSYTASREDDVDIDLDFGGAP